MNARNPVLLCLILLVPSVRGAERGEAWPRHTIDDSSRGADGVRLADANGDGRLDICTGWEEGGQTRVYLNPGPSAARKPWPRVVVGHTPSAEDAVFADLDGDGALDVVSCTEGKCRRIFVQWAPTGGQSYTESSAWLQDTIPSSVDLMQWMFAVPVELDGRDGTELVAAGKNRGAAVGWWEAAENRRLLKDYLWHPIGPVGWVMSIIPSDMDGDGDPDVVISDRKGAHRACRWLENPGPGSALGQAWRNHVIGGEGREVMFMTLSDLDGDGLEDALAAVKPADVLWLRRLDKTGTAWKEQRIPFPANMGTAKAVAVGDIDRDGRNDLVITCEHAEPPRSGVVWLSCEGPWDKGTWRDHEISGPEGVKYDRIELIDLDEDGDLDVLTCEERRGLGVFWHENPARSDH